MYEPLAHDSGRRYPPVLLSGLNWSLVRKKKPDDAQEAYRRADHCEPEGARGRSEDGRSTAHASA